MWWSLFLSLASFLVGVYCAPAHNGEFSGRARTALSSLILNICLASLILYERARDLAQDARDFVNHNLMGKRAPVKENKSTACSPPIRLRPPSLRMLSTPPDEQEKMDAFFQELNQ